MAQEIPSDAPIRADEMDLKTGGKRRERFDMTFDKETLWKWPMIVGFIVLTLCFCIPSQGHASLPDPVTFRIQMELGNVDQAKTWLDEGLDPDFQGDRLGSGLHIAAWNGNIPLMTLFLSHGAHIDLNNAHQEQPLQLAAMQGKTAAVDWLIAQGAPVQPKNRRHSVWTALHYAAFSGNTALVSRLIEKGADINARAPNGTTPLMAAIYAGKPEVAEWLIRRGANQSLKNDWGDGARDWARKNNQIALLQLMDIPDKSESRSGSSASDTPQLQPLEIRPTESQLRRLGRAPSTPVKRAGRRL